MIFSELDASPFKHSTVFYNNEFESILAVIIVCYNCIVTKKIALPNDENKIRDNMLKNYLKKDEFKRTHNPLEKYLFDKETEENTGRVDIRIMPINPFINDDAYYIIECKRLNNQNLNGTSGLNGKYIEEGIYRFVSEKYSTYYKTNGMIGFIVEPLNISDNINSINMLLKTEFPQVNTHQVLKQRIIKGGFDFSYCSVHKLQQREILLYHLMFDLSGNIR